MGRIISSSHTGEINVCCCFCYRSDCAAARPAALNRGSRDKHRDEVAEQVGGNGRKLNKSTPEGQTGDIDTGTPRKSVFYPQTEPRYTAAQVTQMAVCVHGRISLR